MARLAFSRRARLSIPRVNQNPRLQSARKVGTYRTALANRATVTPAHRAAATSPRTAATTTAQTTNASASSAPSAPAAPQSSAPAAPKAPGGLFDLPAYTPQAGQPDPRDATYWANLSKLKFTAEQEYSKSLFEQQHADTDYADALQAAIRNRGLQQRSLGEDAIRSNLGSSGWLNRNEALQTSQYTQDRAHAALSKQEEDEARLAAREALVQGFGIDAAAELAAAGSRYAERAAEAAANAPPEIPAAASAVAGPTGTSAGSFWGAKGPGGYMYLKPKSRISNRRKA